MHSAGEKLLVSPPKCPARLTAAPHPPKVLLWVKTEAQMPMNSSCPSFLQDGTQFFLPGFFPSAPVTSTFAPEPFTSLSPILSSTGQTLLFEVYKTLPLRSLVPVTHAACLSPRSLHHCVNVGHIRYLSVPLVSWCRLALMLALPEDQLFLAPYCLSNLRSTVTFSERSSPWTTLEKVSGRGDLVVVVV